MITQNRFTPGRDAVRQDTVSRTAQEQKDDLPFWKEENFSWR
jgi:hypothetical protein